MKPIKISAHKNEASYTYGDFRIHTERKSSGDGVYRRRQSWTSSTITHRTLPGYSMAGTLKTAVALIDKKGTALLS